MRAFPILLGPEREPVHRHFRCGCALFLPTQQPVPRPPQAVPLAADHRRTPRLAGADHDVLESPTPTRSWSRPKVSRRSHRRDAQQGPWRRARRSLPAGHILSKTCPTPVAVPTVAARPVVGDHGVNETLPGQPHASRDSGGLAVPAADAVGRARHTLAAY